MIQKNQTNPPAPPASPLLSVPAPNAPSTPSFPGPIGSEELGLISDLRQLWIQLAIWSRSLIVSTAANLRDRQFVTDRLMYLPEAFARVLGQYFEPQEADGFRELLQEHIALMTALFAAEKDKDYNLVNHEAAGLYDNASRIASYLANIDSFWNSAQWRDLFYDYIKMLLADMVARMGGNYAKEIDIFDDLQTQAIALSDYMTQGVMQKFTP